MKVFKEDSLEGIASEKKLRGLAKEAFIKVNSTNLPLEEVAKSMDIQPAHLRNVMYRVYEEFGIGGIGNNKRKTLNEKIESILRSNSPDISNFNFSQVKSSSPASHSAKIYAENRNW